MENENPILLFDWDRDVRNTPVPRRAMFNIKPIEGRMIGGLEYEPFFVVQADPGDVVTVAVKTKVNDKADKEIVVKKCYHMHPLIWLNTIDEYMNQYCRVYEQLCYNRNTEERIEVKIPDLLHNKLNNQKKEIKSKRKVLGVSADYLRYVGNNASKNVSGERYQIPKHGASFYLNCLYRDLCTHANAKKQKLALEYDGLKYIEGDWIPKFSFIDYYWHEAITGISLSIEITAILLEVQKKMCIDALWDKAFGDFCEKALPTIVKSRMYFTRNAIARNFFQQIYLEQTIRSYEWEGNKKNDWENNDYWEGLINRALIPCGLLNRYPYEPDIPETELEQSLAHLWGLLKSMEQPVDFSEYIERPTHGLAVFCNPKHEYVSCFLNELGESTGIGKKDRIKPSERKLFTKVHKAVKAAMSG